MTYRQLNERLRRWYAAELEPAEVPERLWAAVAEIPDTLPVPRRALEWRPVLLLAAALMLLLTMAGAIAVGLGVVDVDRQTPDVLDPAGLDPCTVLPGPGLPVVGVEGRATSHAAPTIVSGVVCAYGWDDGSNPHFQIRDRPTTIDEGRAIAMALFNTDTGSRPPLTGSIDGGLTWLGEARWGDPCVAMAVSTEPYFFVIWLTCRVEVSPVPTATLRTLEQSGIDVARGILNNLAALNAGREPPYRLEKDWGTAP